MKNDTNTAALSFMPNEAGYDPIGDRLRENIRATIEAVLEEKLAAFLGRCRYDRGLDKPTPSMRSAVRHALGPASTQNVVVPALRRGGRSRQLSRRQHPAGQ